MITSVMHTVCVKLKNDRLVEASNFWQASNAEHFLAKDVRAVSLLLLIAKYGS